MDYHSDILPSISRDRREVCLTIPFDELLAFLQRNFRQTSVEMGLTVQSAPLTSSIWDLNLSISHTAGPEAGLIVARSLSRWQAALRLAESAAGIPRASLNLETVLSRTPSLPPQIPNDLAWVEACCLATKTERIHTSSLPNFVDWEGKPNNGIAILVLGWAYILTASLAERQNLAMEYASTSDNPSRGPEINLDYASPHEIAWWKAITAPGIGWSISGGQISPWALQVDDIGLSIRGKLDVSQRLPRSREAAHYLSRLYHAYDLGSQCSAALAAALALPSHTVYHKPATIELPRPSFPIPAHSPGQQGYPIEFDNLGYYMSFSLSESIFELAPLWLGVALCGPQGLVRLILSSLEKAYYYPQVVNDINSAAWTGMAQSFMHIHPPGPYLRKGMVSRADMREEDVELEIRNHLQCSVHRWKYAWWTWLPGGIKDVGYLPDGKISLPPEKLPGEGDGMQQGQAPETMNLCHVSKRVTEMAFWYCCTQVEEGFGGTLEGHP
ncbi:hypothetical protein QBC33DRAFT_575934 [Phialemonium atrogriseum]|uniref:Uncharacterized protein n=1 Tax=Phialemonium atrogriseum TaxID=1093897 RepID=A0AAJ0C6J0_9PEZI|nr:uncharacterized protein QBC33DRAFT_575934 [Phialemonium atrogriseum]KAK1771080.1 hypothetical protein QBC33DRAFT_575934 [Phialemonium atrogriseum]